MDEIKLLTAKEVAEILSVSKPTVYKLIRHEDLKAIRVGKSYRISQESLNEILQGLRKGTDNGKK